MEQKSLGITYTDRPLTEAYERAIVADLFFFSPSIFTTISSTVTATHVVAVIGAVAAVGLPCRALLFHIFLLLFSACKCMYVFREITFQAHVRNMTTAAARPKQQASK